MLKSECVSLNKGSAFKVKNILFCHKCHLGDGSELQVGPDRLWDGRSVPEDCEVAKLPPILCE